MAYDLAALANLRTDRPLRAFHVPQALINAYDRELQRIPAEWWAAWRDDIGPAYEAARSTLTRDNEADDVEAALVRARIRAERVAVLVTAALPAWMGELIAWHNRQWTGAVRAAAGVNVSGVMRPIADYDAMVRAMLERNASLIRSIDDQTRQRISDIVWRGFTENTPRSRMGREVAEAVGMSRRRARLIAVDQTTKVGAELTRMRMREAGLDSYQWRHSGKVNYRPEHLERDGKIYPLGEPEGDQPGDWPFCGCIAQPVIERGR